MEKKFESELGKRIVEGNRRKSTKKVVLVIAAVSVMTLLVGAASFTMAMQANAGGPDFIYEELLLDGYLDTVPSPTDLNDDAVQRVMNLKFKSSAPPGESDGGLFRFTYGINIHFKEMVDGIGTGTAVGYLNISFDDDVDDNLVSFATDAKLYNPAGNEIRSGKPVVSDAEVDADIINVTAAIPVFYATDLNTVVPLAAGYSLSISVQITIEDSPLLSGTLTEQPWPTLTHEVYDVDENFVGDAYNYVAYDNVAFAVPVQS